jgi:MOSC domain-containing protein
MTESHGSVVGRIVGIWRYPVKSMLGEELNATTVTDCGLLGDRAFALVDGETGKVASAKNPRRWPTLFDFRAAYVEPPRDDRQLPPVRITFPDGETLTGERADAESRLSANVGRPVRLARTGAGAARAEGYWPDHDWLPQRDEVFDFTLPPGTFFDCATVHLITTATLDRLRTLNPACRFEVPRFRPNFVIAPTDGAEGLVENGWAGRTLALGDVRLRIDGPCPRCVMTTLSQGSLPRDPAILRTAVQENGGNVGVYASVIRGGRTRRGDSVELV